jgi:hypothetical protein
VGDEAVDRNVNSVDLNAIATHEFGHSHGLIDNQISDTDGSASVMVPLVDQGDPASEIARRSLRRHRLEFVLLSRRLGQVRPGEFTAGG